jgi:hypothetical protein
MENLDTAIFEGPLDQENMARVVQAGTKPAGDYHIFNDLDRRTIDGLTKAFSPVCRDRDLFVLMNSCVVKNSNLVYEMVKGMDPWLAFFTIWSTYLKKIGWKYSVDLEGYQIAREFNKQIVFLETIEEQIQVLKNISRDRILWFLKQVDRWPEMAQEYVRCYLKGDLNKLRATGVRFPSRHPAVVDHRDEIFFERMRNHLEGGDTIAFVGAPHVKGMSGLLIKSGFEVSGPNLPSD